jgi:membrane-associated phospholipid phosphatase
MNLTDRIYLAVFAALTLLVCARHDRLEHWPWYAAWNLAAILSIVLLAHKQHDGLGWEFVHDWLPLVFFLTVFEEVSFLSLAIRSGWQNEYLMAFESSLFPVPPAVWMHQRFPSLLVELLEFGYFAFYPLYPVFGGLFWAWRKRPRFAGAFRRLTDALSVGYVLGYATYLLFPTQSPANRLGVQQLASAHSGPFQAMVHLIQDRGGVHGNAFPSSHIMLAFAVLVFAYRFLPRVAPWLLIPILLMCVGAVYDGYHYASDVVAGALTGIVVGTMFTLARQNKTLPHSGG